MVGLLGHPLAIAGGLLRMVGRFENPLGTGKMIENPQPKIKYAH